MRASTEPSSHYERTVLTAILLLYDGIQAVPKRVEDCVSVVFTLGCILGWSDD